MKSISKILSIALILLLFISPVASAAPFAWANLSYLYRQDIVVTSPTYPYQFNISITNETGTSTTSKIYLNNHTKPNFTDVRVYLDNTTALSFWFENNETTLHGKMWINLTSAGTVNIYYGNSSFITSQSNGNNTFPFFDTFVGSALESTRWNTVSVLAGTSSVTVSNSRITITADPNGGIGIVSKTTKFSTTNNSLQTSGFKNIAKPKLSYYTFPLALTSDNTHHMLDAAFTGQGYAIRWNNDNTMNLLRVNGATLTTLQTVTVPMLTDGTIQDLRLAINNTNVSVYINNTLILSQIDVTYRNNLYPASYAYATSAYSMDTIFVTNFTFPEPRPPGLSGEIPQYSNNVTNNQSLNLSIFNGTTMSFYDYRTNITGAGIPLYPWYDNSSGVPVILGYGNLSGSGVIFNYTVSHNVIIERDYDLAEHVHTDWNITSVNVSFQLVSPANGSIVNNPVTICAKEAPLNDPYQYFVYSDPGHINVVSMGSTVGTGINICVDLFDLEPNQTFYWNMKNASGLFADADFNFTVSAVPIIPSYINLIVKDEITGINLSGLNVTIYNTTNQLNRQNSTGYWINFTNGTLSEGEYTAFVNAYGYAQRIYLLDAPGNYTLYLGSSGTTSLLNFLLLDYTNQFPFTSTKLYINKIINNTAVTVYSNYFDAQAVASANLLNNEQYSLTVINNETSSVRGLGNIIPLANANINLLVSDITFRPNSSLNGLNQSVGYNNNTSVSLLWSDPNNEIISQDFTIWNETGSLLYQVVTTIHNGQVSYAITSDELLYVCLNTTTSSYGALSACHWYNPPRSVEVVYPEASNISMSQSAKNFAAFFLLLVVAYLYGRQHTIRGSLYVSIIALLEAVTGWLIIPILGYAGTVPLMVVLLIISVIANISERER